MSPDLVLLCILAVAAVFVIARALPLARAPSRRMAGGAVMTIGTIALGYMIYGPEYGAVGAALLLVAAMLVALGAALSRDGLRLATPGGRLIGSGGLVFVVALACAAVVPPTPAPERGGVSGVAG